MTTRSQVLTSDQLMDVNVTDPIRHHEIFLQCSLICGSVCSCVFAVKRKKAILSDSEDEEEEKADKPGKMTAVYRHH